MGREIVFNSFKIHELIGTFATHFHTKVQNDGVQEKITIPAKYGSGEIDALDFKDGLSILIFSCQLKEEIILKYTAKTNQPLRLLFCIQNEITHTVKTDGMQYRLSSMQSSMVSGKSGSQQQIIISENKPAIFYWIDISRKKYHPKIAQTIKIMPPELRKVFEDVNSKHSFLYLGGYSLAIAQIIQNIIQSKFEGVVRRVYLESQTLEIMSLQIKQFIEDLAPGGRQKVLRKRDQQLIMEAREKLLVDLVSPPTIKELAQMIGTNENKLKAGFRLLYDTSINKLLQDERLSKAKLLMAEEAFPIKEVAKMVGYKHSAHFASKFKKRFGILPNEYLKSMLK